MAKIILMDWQRGRIPYFVLPPGMSENQGEEDDNNMSNNINIESTENANLTESAFNKKANNSFTCHPPFESQSLVMRLEG